MEISYCALILALMAAYAHGTEIIVTRPGGGFHMGNRVEIPCVYTGSDWLVMRWIRNGVVLAYVVKGLDNPQWMDTAPNSFQDHVELDFKKDDDTGYSLNMTIDGLKCTDTGEYKCEVTTLSATVPFFNTTNIEILVDPIKPQIMDGDYFHAKENVTFELSCSGRVGIPPATIKWFVKTAVDGDFQPLDPALTSQTNTQGEGDMCWYSGNARVTVTMEESLDGALYACAVGDVMDTKDLNFDEVVLVLQGSSGSGVNSLSLMAACCCVLISVLNVFTGRTP
ncbi:uncharacterized protein LOC128236278 isoform X2 [Mya arenaria]|uniref:uncharacterized protein LOC128236278 isoform X2 n=1 Tax=Mya arenaria TaxID=6604 RepID=UPI0022E3594B|nr:uncharacterized protein LOC128236278 isoform X2 [Mya arenaria]